MKRIFSIRLSAMLVGVAVGLSGSAWALGLGRLAVYSKLNQPLNADIRLVALHDVALEEIQVGLASAEQYARVSQLLHPVLSRVEFRLATCQNEPCIKLSSSEPIKEPYLQLLLDIKWPRGEFIRAYNVLLDPAHYQQEPDTDRQELPVRTIKANVVDDELLVQAVQASQLPLNHSPVAKSSKPRKMVKKTCRKMQKAEEKNSALQHQLSMLKAQNRQLAAQLKACQTRHKALPTVHSTPRIPALEHTNTAPQNMVRASSSSSFFTGLLMLVSGPNYVWYRHFIESRARAPIAASAPKSLTRVAEATPRLALVSTVHSPPTGAAKVHKPTKVALRTDRAPPPPMLVVEHKSKPVPARVIQVNRLITDVKQSVQPVRSKPVLSKGRASLTTKAKLKRSRHPKVRVKLSPEQRKLAQAERLLTAGEREAAYSLLTEVIDDGDEKVVHRAQRLLDKVRRD
jgi:FimV-like protein